MTDWDERTAALARRFEAQAAEMAKAIEISLARGAWNELVSPCHSLAGRAGMFGHVAIGDAARALEEAIGEGVPPREMAPLASQLLDRLAALRQDR